MPLVAGIDSSTSGCKIAIRDADTGELVASGRGAHPGTTPPRSEQHPQAWATACGRVPGASFTITKPRWLLVARGAAIQAAATLTGRPVADVASDWALEVAEVEPASTTDPRSLRDAYAAAESAGPYEPESAS